MPVGRRPASLTPRQDRSRSPRAAAAHRPRTPMSAPTTPTVLTPRSTLLQFPDVFIDSRLGYQRLAMWEDRGDSKVVKKFITDQEEAERLAFVPNLRPTRETMEARGRSRRPPGGGGPMMLHGGSMRHEPGGRGPAGGERVMMSRMEMKRVHSAPHPLGSTSSDPGPDPRAAPRLEVTAIRASSLDRKPENSDDDVYDDDEDDVSLESGPVAGTPLPAPPTRGRPTTAHPGRKPRVAFTLPGDQSEDGDETNNDTKNAELNKNMATTSGSGKDGGGERPGTPDDEDHGIRVEIKDKQGNPATPTGGYTSSGISSSASIRDTAVTSSARYNSSVKPGTERNSAASDPQRFVSPAPRKPEEPEKEAETDDSGFVKTSFNDLESSASPTPKEEKESKPKEVPFDIPTEPVITLPLMSSGGKEVDRVKEFQRQRALKNLEPPRKFTTPPGPQPLALCFDHYGTNFTHKQIKAAVDKLYENTPANCLVSLQFVARNVMLGTKWATNRWVITVSGEAAMKLMLLRGLSVGNMTVRCRRYEDVLKEEYNKWLEQKSKVKSKPGSRST